MQSGVLLVGQLGGVLDDDRQLATGSQLGALDEAGQAAREPRRVRRVVLARADLRLHRGDVVAIFVPPDLAAQVARRVGHRHDPGHYGPLFVHRWYDNLTR